MIRSFFTADESSRSLLIISVPRRLRCVFLFKDNIQVAFSELIRNEADDIFEVAEFRPINSVLISKQYVINHQLKFLLKLIIDQ